MATKTKNKRVSVPYDKNLLKGVKYVDSSTVVSFIKSLVSNSVMDRKSPYVPIRMLVIFFDKENGVRRHGRKGSWEVIRYLESVKEIRKCIASITVKHYELLEIIYKKGRPSAKELAQKVTWKLKAMIEDVQKLLVNINKSECIALFGHTEAIKGRDDGRMVGLQELVVRANNGLYEILEQMDRLEALMAKGSDPMNYVCPSAYRR